MTLFAFDARPLKSLSSVPSVPPSDTPRIPLTALTPPLFHAGGAKGEGSLFSIVFGRPEAMTTLW